MYLNAFTYLNADIPIFDTISMTRRLPASNAASRRRDIIAVGQRSTDAEDYIWSPLPLLSVCVAMDPTQTLTVHKGKASTLDRRAFNNFIDLSFRRRHAKCKSMVKSLATINNLAHVCRMTLAARASRSLSVRPRHSAGHSVVGEPSWGIDRAELHEKKESNHTP